MSRESRSVEGSLVESRNTRQRSGEGLFSLLNPVYTIIPGPNDLKNEPGSGAVSLEEKKEQQPSTTQARPLPERGGE